MLHISGRGDVRCVTAHEHGGGGGDRSAKILDIYAIGRADRHDPRARSLDDVADADPLADLDQVSRRHDDIPAGGKGAADQEERRGVRRGDRRALRTGQGAQHPLAGLCSAVAAGCSRWRCAGGFRQAFARGVSQRRVAPAGVDDDPRRVDVVARGQALGPGLRGGHAGDRLPRHRLSPAASNWPKPRAPLW